MAKAASNTRTAKVSGRGPRADAKRPPNPEATGPVEVGRIGAYVFTQEIVPEIPKPHRSASANDLPFKGWFPGMRHNGHIFLPKRFWTNSADDKELPGREVDPESVTSVYVKSKIRDAFRKWKKDDPLLSNRELILVERAKGDDNGSFTEDGMSIFMQINDEEKAA